MKILLIIILVIVLFIIFRFKALGRESQAMNVELGIEDGRLKPCKSLLNCVVSYDQDYFQVDTYENSPIKNIVEALKLQGCEIIEQNDHYVRAIDQSKLFGFVDDVEFLYANQELHFRSSSRVGKSDLGANRKRIEKILSQIN